MRQIRYQGCVEARPRAFGTQGEVDKQVVALGKERDAQRPESSPQGRESLERGEARGHGAGAGGVAGEGLVGQVVHEHGGSVRGMGGSGFAEIGCCLLV